MIGPLAAWLLTQCFSVRVGFVCCAAVAFVALVFLPPFGREI